MAISLNNHETRIKALENSGSQNWTRGESSTGIWWKDAKSGLILQHSKGNVTNFGKIKLPIPYSSTKSYTVVATFGKNDPTTEMWAPERSATTSQVVTNSEIIVYAAERPGFGWFTIGYLISYRILNYAYACKSLLFTPLRTTGGVK